MTRRKKTPVGLIILILLLALLILLAAAYLLIANYYTTHFLPNTTVNGADCSGKTAEYLQEKNTRTGEEYLLTVYDRDGNKYLLKGMDFSYAYVDSGEEADLLGQQNPYAWLFELNKTHTYTMTASYTCDEEALEAAILALDLFHADEYEAPTNAALVLSEDGVYEIIAETYGNTPLEDEVLLTIQAAVSAGQTECTLGDDCYLQPEVTSDDAVLTETLAVIEAYCNAAITYEIEGEDCVLTSEQISEMLVVGDDYSVSIDEDKLTSFVQSLASAYNTYGDVRSFTTSLGDVVEIGGGDYGWVIDKSGEAAQILADLEGGEPVSREPVYEQTAMVSGSDDIGDTYVELDYTNQHMYYYVDGELILESDFVSGTLSNGNGSPDGIFKIVYKQRNATLVGENYSTPVDYFMPFAYNVGIHDASWRSSFGGTIYRKSGSHGCINVPAEVAEELYGLIEVGTPVVAYYREEVKLTSESSKISNAYSYVSED